MADNHAKHSAESKRLHDARLRAAADEAWTRGFGAPAHDPNPEPAEILANRGLFADSGGAYDE